MPVTAPADRLTSGLPTPRPIRANPRSLCWRHSRYRAPQRRNQEHHRALSSRRRDTPGRRSHRDRAVRPTNLRDRLSGRHAAVADGVPSLRINAYQATETAMMSTPGPDGLGETSQVRRCDTRHARVASPVGVRHPCARNSGVPGDYRGALQRHFGDSRGSPAGRTLWDGPPCAECRLFRALRAPPSPSILDGRRVGEACAN